jgi:hypothetical protein
MTEREERLREKKDKERRKEVDIISVLAQRVMGTSFNFSKRKDTDTL